MRVGVLRQRPHRLDHRLSVGANPPDGVGCDGSVGIEHRHVQRCALVCVVFIKEGDDCRSRWVSLTRLDELLPGFDPLLRRHKKNVGLADTLSVEQRRIEELRSDDCASRTVGIRLDGDPEAAPLGFTDHRHHLRQLAPRRGIEVTQVHVGAGHCGDCDQLFVALDGTPRLDRIGVAQVSERRHTVARSDLGGADVLLVVAFPRIPQQKTDAERSFLNSFFQQAEDLRRLRLGRELLPIWLGKGSKVRQEVAVEHGIRQHGAAGGRPIRGVAVVQRPALVPRDRVSVGDRQVTSFQIQCRRHAIESLHPHRWHHHPMRVEIDETGCDDLPNCIELDAADETLLGNGGNSATADADVAHRFQSGLGIDDSAAKNHYVEGF